MRSFQKRSKIARTKSWAAEGEIEGWLVMFQRYQFCWYHEWYHAWDVQTSQNTYGSETPGLRSPFLKEGQRHIFRFTCMSHALGDPIHKAWDCQRVWKETMATSMIHFNWNCMDKYPTWWHNPRLKFAGQAFCLAKRPWTLPRPKAKSGKHVASHVYLEFQACGRLDSNVWGSAGGNLMTDRAFQFWFIFNASLYSGSTQSPLFLDRASHNHGSSQKPGEFHTKACMSMELPSAFKKPQTIEDCECWSRRNCHRSIASSAVNF